MGTRSFSPEAPAGFMFQISILSSNLNEFRRLKYSNKKNIGTFSSEKRENKLKA
jgi:hypothetical protein